MKFQNLLGITALSCSLLFVSSGAMAVEDCAGGYLTGFITENIIIPEGGSCIIVKAIVKGKIEAVGAENVTINLARVSGRISIQDSGIVSVKSNQAQYITLARNEIAIVLGNVVRINMIVNKNGRVWIEKNQAGADLTCTDNADGTAVENWAGGTEDCGPIF
jgi:hypothetical protein